MGSAGRPNPHEYSLVPPVSVRGNIATLLGATVGASLGVLAGGAGALPGAAIGGDVGLDAGFVVLAAMGIGFLLPCS